MLERETCSHLSHHLKSILRRLDSWFFLFLVPSCPECYHNQVPQSPWTITSRSREVDVILSETLREAGSRPDRQAVGVCAADWCRSVIVNA